LSFFAAFRVVAWKNAAFSVQRFYLGPGYYCQTCDYNPDNDKVRDKANGCPKCPLTEKFDAICIRNASKAIEQKGMPSGWNIYSLNNLHAVVSGVLHENKDRIDPRWSITFGELCRIIQQERAQMKFVQDFETYKKMKAQAKK
jgi:hypothetical protein